MTIADVAAGAILAVFSGFSFWQVNRLWHSPRNADYMLFFIRRLFSEQVRHGAVRGLLPLAIGNALAAAGVLDVGISHPTTGKPDAGEIAAAVLFGLMLVTFALHATIILFNRPRWLVPPHMRRERGRLTSSNPAGYTGKRHKRGSH